MREKGYLFYQLHFPKAQERLKGMNAVITIEPTLTINTDFLKSTLSKGAKLLFMALQTVKKPNAYTRVTYKFLGSLIHASPSSVSRYMKELTHNGLLQIPPAQGNAPSSTESSNQKPAPAPIKKPDMEGFKQQIIKEMRGIVLFEKAKERLIYSEYFRCLQANEQSKLLEALKYAICDEQKAHQMFQEVMASFIQRGKAREDYLIDIRAKDIENLFGIAYQAKRSDPIFLKRAQALCVQYGLKPVTSLQEKFII